jgi:hypothetical protein
MDLLPLRGDLRDWRSTGVTVPAAVPTYDLVRLSWMFFEHPFVRRGHASQYKGIADSRLQKS